MAKNQKRDVRALRWQTFGFVLFAVCTVAGMTLGYVLQRKAHQRLGEQVVVLERQAQELGIAVQRQRVLQAQLSSPTQLRQRMQELRLELVNVSPTQRLFITVPPAGTLPLPATAPAENDRSAAARPGPTLAATTR
ncbi:MAG TPA: hypothetical protein VMB21_10685 [Candidatus Limnocylindria bacterium]|jgi:hypothetical protein|nr:hypothetical protein [Candidatus Limnocylindria bacterium]